MNARYEIEGLSHSYGGRPALALEWLRVEAGEIVGVLGANGAGKSTLLGVMAFLLVPERGSVRFDGRPVTFGEAALRRQAVLMPQDPCLLRRRVWDNVAYGRRVRGDHDPRRTTEALELVGLDPERFARRWWWELSGGETRRVALAARLALSPKVLLLDEPTASLDPESSHLVSQAVTAARDRHGCSAVIVSHDREWLQGLGATLYRLSPGTGLEPITTGDSPCAP